MPTSDTTSNTVNRDILRLAVPALGALVAEPLFLMVDTGLVGHLGVTPLAGLAIAGAVLQTIVGLMVFLAYSTTPAVARRYGAGQSREAISVGIDGLWLALGLGLGLAVVGFAIDARGWWRCLAPVRRFPLKPRFTWASRWLVCQPC